MKVKLKGNSVMNLLSKLTECIKRAFNDAFYHYPLTNCYSNHCTSGTVSDFWFGSGQESGHTVYISCRQGSVFYPLHGYQGIKDYTRREQKRESLASGILHFMWIGIFKTSLQTFVPTNSYCHDYLKNVCWQPSPMHFFTGYLIT